MITLILLPLALKPRLPVAILIIRRPPLRIFGPVHHGSGFEEDEGADDAEAGGHEHAGLGVGALDLSGEGLAQLIASVTSWYRGPQRAKGQGPRAEA